MIQRKEIFTLLAFLLLSFMGWSQPMHGILRVQAKAYAAVTYHYSYPGIDSVAPVEKLNFEHPTDLWGLRLWGEDAYQDIYQGDYFCAPIAYVDTAYLTIRQKDQYEPMQIELIATPGLADHNLIFDFRPGRYRFELDKLKSIQMGNTIEGFTCSFEIGGNLSDDRRNHWMILKDITEFEYVKTSSAFGLYVYQHTLEENRPGWYKKMNDASFREPDCPPDRIGYESFSCNQSLYAQPLLMTPPAAHDSILRFGWTGNLYTSDLPYSYGATNEVLWEIMSLEQVPCNRTYSRYRIYHVHFNSDSLLGLELLEYAGVPSNGMRDSMLRFKHEMEAWCHWKAESDRRSAQARWKSIVPFRWFRTRTKRPELPALPEYDHFGTSTIQQKPGDVRWQEVSDASIVDWYLLNRVTAGGKSVMSSMRDTTVGHAPLPPDRHFVCTYSLKDGTFPAMEDIFGFGIRDRIFEYLKNYQIRHPELQLNLYHYDPARFRLIQWTLSEFGLLLGVGAEGEFWQSELVLIPWDWLQLPEWPVEDKE